MNLVPLLLDMGYDSKEDIVNAMCRHGGKADPNGGGFDHAAIESLYDRWARKKREAQQADSPSYKGRCSVGCGTIINSTFASGNNIRCHYEAKANGSERRANHTDHEKRKFRLQCGTALEAGLRIVSPMDFVAYKARQILVAEATAKRQQQRDVVTNEGSNSNKCLS